MAIVEGDRQVLTLADFLLARIADEEQAAHAAEADWGWTSDHESVSEQGHWSSDPRGIVTSKWGEVIAGHQLETGCMWFSGQHIALWDPARVLAECEAKRRIVELHADGNADIIAYATRDHGLNSYCVRCTVEHDGEPWPCLTLRLLAQPYADHPDYRAEWAV